MAKERTGRAIENIPFETPQARQARIMILLATAVRRLNPRVPARGDQGVRKNVG